MPYLYNSLKPIIRYTDDKIESPIIGDDKYYYKKDLITSGVYPIYIYKNTFIYRNESDNLICKDDEDLLLLKEIKKFKRESRMANDNSEDALTWNVFRTIERGGKLQELLRFLLGIDITNPKIVYWSYDQENKCLYSELIDAREKCKESKTNGTEPDLIIECDQATIAIEAKFTSSNRTHKEDDDVLNKYQSNLMFNKLFKKTMSDISKKGKYEKYELARNWLIGEYLRKEKKFILINLVKNSNEKDICEAMKEIFIEDENHKFIKKTWEDIYKFCNIYYPFNFSRLIKYMANKTIGYHDGVLIKAFDID